MIPPARVLKATRTLIVALGVGLSMAALGCRRSGHEDSRVAAGNSDIAQDVVALDSPTQRSGTATPRGNDLSVCCRRASGFVGQHLREYNRRLTALGLPPARVKLEVRPAASVEDCERKALLARRVSQLLVEELARIEGLTVSVENQATTQGANALTLDITNDFEAEAFFESVHAHFVLELSHNDEQYEYRDSFASEGLVRIVSPAGELHSVFVSAEKPDDVPVINLLVKPDEWFLLPVGTYRHITVRSKMGVWRAPTRVGLQNLWDLSASSTTSNDGPTGETQVCSVRPEAVRAQNASPSLEIVSPRDGAAVARCCSVYGNGSGLEGCSVEVVVTPFGDVEYPQDIRSLIKGGVWRSPRCYFGRANGDSGHQFYLRARAFADDGTLLAESPVIVVTRK